MHIDAIIEPWLSGYSPMEVSYRNNNKPSDSKDQHDPPHDSRQTSNECDLEDGGGVSIRMMRILRNAHKLHPRARSFVASEDVKAASLTMLSDIESLLCLSAMSFRMSLQCVFTTRLISMFAPCSAERQRAERVFAYWYSRLTLQC